jgi:Ca-activated chloride channel family protein
VYRTGADAVVLAVTVTTPAGQHVPNLTAADFQVFEDGVLQEISHFANHPEPISLSLLIDTSASMELDSRLTIAQQAAVGFIGRLNEEDLAQILDFDNQTKILAAFTGDKAELERALRKMKPGGSTSLYNAVYTAISELRREQQGRKDIRRRQAIVLLSDGEDTSSIVPYEDVLELAKRSEVNVYAIAMQPKEPRGGWNEAEFVLKSLTRDAGGRVFFVTDPQQLPAIYTQISEELSHQYSVGYVPKNTKRDAAWRRITVQVMKRDALPRTRSGYYAPGPLR